MINLKYTSIRKSASIVSVSIMLLQYGEQQPEGITRHTDTFTLSLILPATAVITEPKV